MVPLVVYILLLVVGLVGIVMSAVSNSQPVRRWGASIGVALVVSGGYGIAGYVHNKSDMCTANNGVLIRSVCIDKSVVIGD